MNSTSLALLLLLAPGCSDEARAAIPVPPGLSWAHADAVGRKLEDLERRFRARAAVVPSRRVEAVFITEVELNSYLNLSLHSKMPTGLSDVSVRLGPGRIAAKAMVDLEQVRGRAPADKGTLSLLGGRVPLEVMGRLRSEPEGFGAFEFEEVRLGGWPLPIPLLAELVASSTRKPNSPQGVDIHAPFRLPYRVKRIRFQPGVAFLEL